MNWLKDNLILILAGLCVIAGLGWAITHFRASAALARLETRVTVAETDANNLRLANASNLTTINELRAANKTYADQRRIDFEAANAASERFNALLGELHTQQLTNKALRAELARENEDVAAYLADGMPCELARSLWGEQAGYCSD